jgi:hypothetical protein
MNKHRIISLLLLPVFAANCSMQPVENSKQRDANDNVPLSAGAKLLFTKKISALSNQQKNDLFKKTSFILTKTKDAFYMDEAEDFPFNAQVFPVDLNNDGKEDIFLLWGNTFTSGNAGSSVSLYIQNEKGSFTESLVAEGQLPLIIKDATKSYPDLILIAPGVSFPLWGWRNNDYTFIAQISAQKLKTYKTEQVELISQRYQKTLQLKK